MFDKVIEGVTYTKKVVLRNREKVGRRLRLEVDPQSPFRISPLKYPVDEAIVQPAAASSGERPLASRASGLVATGMRVQVGMQRGVLTPQQRRPNRSASLGWHC